MKKKTDRQLIRIGNGQFMINVEKKIESNSDITMTNDFVEFEKKEKNKRINLKWSFFRHKFIYS